MKNKFKLLGIITLAAAIGFSMAAGHLYPEIKRKYPL
jgi:hypothetical protein